MKQGDAMPAAMRSIRTRDGFRLRGAFLPACLAAALPGMLFWAAPAAAQVAPPSALAMPAFDPGVTQPIQQPQRLALFHVPAFRFAVESLNLGMPLPNAPARVLAQGAGSVARGPTTTGWNLAIERLMLDGQVIAAAAPLATLTVSVGNDAPAQRFYRVEYPGLDTLPQAPPRSPIRNMVRALVDTIAFSLPVPPSQPVVDRSPVADIGVALQRYVSQALPDAQLVQPPAPAVAVGLVDRFARQGLLARQEGPFAVRTAYRDTVLRSEAVGVIDLATALPLFVQARVFGPVDLPFFRGPVDYGLRVAIALPDMGDPAAMLAPPAPPPPVAARPAVAAPRPQAVAQQPTPSSAAPPPRSEEELRRQVYQGLIARVDAAVITDGHGQGQANVGRQDPYSQKPSPKVLAICLFWQDATANNVRRGGFTREWTGKPPTPEVMQDLRERAMENCIKRETQGCRCQIVDENGQNRLFLPEDFKRRALAAAAAPPAPRPTPAPPAPATPAAKPAAPPAVKPPVASPPPAPAQGDAVQRLEALKSLYDRGLITKEQYEAKQKEILGAL
jgi:hypothetical protein